MDNLNIKKNRITGNYNISAAPGYFWGIAALLIILSCCLIFSLIYIGIQKERNINLRKLQAENIKLRRKLDLYAVQVDSIMTILDKIQKKNEKNQSRSKEQAFLYSHPDLDADTVTESDFSYDSYLYAQNHYVNQRLTNVLAYLPQLMKQNMMEKPVAVTVEDKLAEMPSIYPAFGRMSDLWGSRIHPIYHEMIFHYGLDIANKIGTPIYATGAGIIVFNGYDQYYGRIIKIEHGKDYETRYAHLYRSTVLTGDTVKKGQIIGYMGDSGLSTGPHLHYEIIAHGAKVNPSAYLNKFTNSLLTRHTSAESKIIR